MFRVCPLKYVSIDDKNNATSKSYFFCISFKSVTSKEYLFRNKNKEKILCAKKIEIDDKYVAVTDTRNMSTDYEVYISPNNIFYISMIGVTGLITSSIIFYLKRK